MAFGIGKRACVPKNNDAMNDDLGPTRDLHAYAFALHVVDDSLSIRKHLTVSPSP